MTALMLASGQSIHSQRVLKWLLQANCGVVFCDGVNPLPAGAAGYRFIPYPRTPGERYFRRLLSNRLSNALVDRFVVEKLRRLWPTLKADLAHVHFVDRRAHHCVLAGIRPLVLTVWGSDINRHFKVGADQEYRAVTGRALAAADLVITDTEELSEKCRVLAGREIATELLPLGIDTRAFGANYDEAAKELRKKLDVPEDGKILLSIRAFSVMYQHHVILEAFTRALPRLAGNAYLVFKIYNRGFYAEADEYERRLRRRADELGITARVRWMEQVPHEELPVVYALSTAVISYPTMDGFPVTFMEAAASGRPVISVRLPAYAGTFAEKHFTMLEPGNNDDLTAAIVQVLNEAPSARADQISAERRAVEQDYDERVSAERLMEIYRRVIGHGGRRG
jgi:glycosyltransferase involved in cell wall biosynthesis